MPWVDKDTLKMLRKENDELRLDVQELNLQINELSDDSAEAAVQKLKRLAKELQIDTFSQEYQDMAGRVFMSLGSRYVPVLKGYSATAFIKDNSEEVLNRVQELKQEMSIITKKLPGRKK